MALNLKPNLTTWEKPKAYQEIKKKICENLVENWQPNDRLPPIKELAKCLGVGQSSTHQAVKELVRDGILISRPKMGTFVNDDMKALKPRLANLLREESTPQASNLLAGKKIQIITYRSVIETHTFFSRAIDAFVAAINEVGCEVFNTMIDYPKTVDIEPFLQKQADGVVLVNPSTFLKIKCLPSQVLTVINPSAECTVTMSERFDMVAIDDTQGSLLAGEFLRSKGWRDVCFLGVKTDLDSPPFGNVSLKRLKGLNLGLGAEIRPEWQLTCNSYVGFSAAKCTLDWLKLSPRPSVIFAASDDLAYGFIYGALGHGLIPGKDYQIMGFDAQKKESFDEDCILTSIDIPIEEMGTVAAKMLMKRLENPDATPHRTYLGCQLFEGTTVINKNQT
jgi:DNA-binding LacI/PurR family transcriptional regulator